MTDLERLKFTPRIVWECEADDGEKLAAAVSEIQMLARRTGVTKTSRRRWDRPHRS